MCSVKFITTFVFYKILYFYISLVAFGVTGYVFTSEMQSNKRGLWRHTLFQRGLPRHYFPHAPGTPGYYSLKNFLIQIKIL